MWCALCCNYIFYYTSYCVKKIGMVATKARFSTEKVINILFQQLQPKCGHKQNNFNINRFKLRSTNNYELILIKNKFLTENKSLLAFVVVVDDSSRHCALNRDCCDLNCQKDKRSTLQTHAICIVVNTLSLQSYLKKGSYKTYQV